MSKRKSMKIRVRESSRDAIRKALVSAGYEVVGKMLDISIFDQADAYYTYGSNDFVLCSVDSDNDNYFERHENPEHFLVNGEFVTKDYWNYPETTYAPLPDECTGAGGGGKGIGTLTFVVPGNISKVQATIAQTPTITPRVEFLRQRVSEILAAMTRFNDLKIVPPSEWHLELEDIFEEIRHEI